MKIKIIQSTYDDYWYSEHIGEEFKVEENGICDYRITDINSEYYHWEKLKVDFETIIASDF